MTGASTHGEQSDALSRARHIRSERAALKRDLRTGRLRLSDLLNSPPTAMVGARIDELLLSIRGVGPAKAARIARRAGIALESRVDELDAAALSALAAK